MGPELSNWHPLGPNIFRGEYHDSFNMDLMCKDIQLCFDMAKSAKVISFFSLSKRSIMYANRICCKKFTKF